MKNWQFLSIFVLYSILQVSSSQSESRESRGLLEMFQSYLKPALSSLLKGSPGQNENQRITIGPVSSAQNNNQLYGNVQTSYYPSDFDQNQYQNNADSQYFQAQNLNPQYVQPSSQFNQQLYQQQQQQQLLQQQQQGLFPVQHQQQQQQQGVGGAGGIISNLIGNALQSQNQISNTNTNNAGILTALGIGEDIASLASLLNFNTVESMISRVNKFDSLKCIPRMMCQMIAKRQSESESSTTTTTTRKPKSLHVKKSRFEGLRTLKVQGLDTALEQFVKFLDLMQLKDWSLYPYLQGAYHGAQVKRSDDCATKFSTCPFSDDQLVYYFNNYNGGFFQSFRSNLDDGHNSRNSQKLINGYKLKEKE